MDTLVNFVGLLSRADPTVLVAVVCVVALLVVGETVRQMCKAFGKKGDE
jgi:hypothetical protein